MATVRCVWTACAQSAKVVPCKRVANALSKINSNVLVNFEVLTERYITLLEEKKAKKKLLNNAGDGVGVAFVCNEKNKYYKVLHTTGIDPNRDILPNHE